MQDDTPIIGNIGWHNSKARDWKLNACSSMRFLKQNDMCFMFQGQSEENLSLSAATMPSTLRHSILRTDSWAKACYAGSNRGPIGQWLLCFLLELELQFCISSMLALCSLLMGWRGTPHESNRLASFNIVLSTQRVLMPLRENPFLKPEVCEDPAIAALLWGSP